MKIAMKLPFTIKNKRRKTNFKFELKKTTILDTQKSVFLVFEENPPTNFLFVFWLWFSFKNIRRTNFLSIGIFENAQQKSYWPSKTQFWLFLAVNNIFWCVFKNTDQNNICVSNVLKAKTEKKIQTNWLTPKKSIFQFWNKNHKKIFFHIFLLF